MSYRFAVGARQGDNPILRIRTDYCRELMISGLGNRAKEYFPTETPMPEIYLNSHWGMRVPVSLSARVGHANRIMAKAGFDRQLFYQDQDDLLERDGWVKAWPDIVTELPLLHAILGFLKLETGYAGFMLGMMAHMVNNREYKLRKVYDGCASFLGHSNPSLWKSYARELLASGKGDLLGSYDLLPIVRTLILYETGLLSQEMLNAAFLHANGHVVSLYKYERPPHSIWDMSMCRIICESRGTTYSFTVLVEVPIPELKTSQQLIACNLSLFGGISYPYNE